MFGTCDQFTTTLPLYSNNNINALNTFTYIVLVEIKLSESIFIPTLFKKHQLYGIAPVNEIFGKTGVAEDQVTLIKIRFYGKIISTDLTYVVLRTHSFLLSSFAHVVFLQSTDNRFNNWQHNITFCISIYRAR